MKINRKRFDADEPKAERRSGLFCIAHGCPLVGTISHSTQGGNWTCWAHDRTEPVEWPRITEGIRSNLWLFNLAARISVMTVYELGVEKQGEIEAFLKSRHMSDLCRKEGEHKQAWVVRIREHAYAAAKTHERLAA